MRRSADIIKATLWEYPDEKIYLRTNEVPERFKAGDGPIYIGCDIYLVLIDGEYYRVGDRVEVQEGVPKSVDRP